MYRLFLHCLTERGTDCNCYVPIAVFLYHNYQAQFNLWTLLVEWLKLVCFNFPFVFFTQLFFIQPFVRTAFKFIFAKDIKARSEKPEGQPTVS